MWEVTSRRPLVKVEAWQTIQGFTKSNKGERILDIHDSWLIVFLKVCSIQDVDDDESPLAIPRWFRMRVVGLQPIEVQMYSIVFPRNPSSCKATQLSMGTTSMRALAKFGAGRPQIMDPVR